MANYRKAQKMNDTGHEMMFSNINIDKGECPVS
jgi:hypothetical protein